MWGLSEYVNIIMEYCLAWQMYYSQTDNLVEILDIIKGPIYLLWTIFFPQEETWNEQQVSGEEPGSEEGGEGGEGEEDGAAEVWLLKKPTNPICPMPDFNWAFPLSMKEWDNVSVWCFLKEGEQGDRAEDCSSSAGGWGLDTSRQGKRGVGWDEGEVRHCKLTKFGTEQWWVGRRGR